jgi:NADH-quinone oxidoreductase subunit M
LLTFLGLLFIVIWDYMHPIGSVGVWKMTYSIPQLIENFHQRPMDPTLQIGLFLALFAGFAIKVPLFPLHTWLPLAHVQAPTAGSVILAGVLLKIGTYGFVRFNLTMLPDASASLMPWMLGLAAAGILYGSLVALVQKDMKKLIAYSSVSHLGFCMLGIFALNPLGIEGGTLQMINHGLSTGGLFAVVGMLYERYHTRQIADLGGLAKKLPILSFFMLVLTLSSIGLPGLNGFVGEFLILLGTFQRAWAGVGVTEAIPLKIISVIAVSGVVLGAWYMLWMYQRLFFGPLREPKDEDHHEAILDMNFREACALLPLIVFIVWIGVYPKFFLDRMRPTLEQSTSAAQSMRLSNNDARMKSCDHWSRSMEQMRELSEIA